MKSLLRTLTMGLMLFVPLSPAWAQTPTVSPISDLSLNAGASQNVNVVAVGAPGNTITLTSSLPAFATLNAPTSGTGLVSTTITLAPTAGDVGTFNASVTATSGALSSTENFQITVNASGSNRAPVVVAPATQNVTAGSNLSFTVTASDADGDAITSLTQVGLPSGASFTPNGTNTSASFSWTPTAGQTGDYDIVFTAANSLSGSATTHIHVAAAENHAPTLTAPSTQTVTEGQTLSFTVSASDVDGDHVTLTTGALPAGATATDQGNNTMTFSWQPSTSQSGTYTVTFNGDDGHGGTVSATTTITVLDSGGGGPATATVTMFGNFNTHRPNTCFRIRSVNNSFDLRNVQLSSVTLEFNGHTLTPLSGKTHLMFDCEDEDSLGDDGDHDDAARLHRDGGFPGDHDGDDDDDDCEECDDDCDTCNTANCDVVGIRACFATQAIISLFGDSTLPASLGDADIRFTLSDGTVVVTNITGDALTRHDNGHGKDKLHVRARPNPLNPRTELSFTLSKGGRVQVGVYDMQGRLVNRLWDGNLPAGEQKLIWDGSNSRNTRVTSGVYYFRIQAPEGVENKRVAVVK